MREAITIVQRHGAESKEVLYSPSEPIDAQLTAFRELCMHREHPDYRQVELWYSDTGRAKRRKFYAPGTLTAKTEAVPQLDADASATVESAPERLRPGRRK